MRIADDHRGTVVRVTLPVEPGAESRWLGVWTLRGDVALPDGWTLRLHRVIGPLGQRIAPGGVMEVVLPHGSGPGMLRGVGVCVIDAVGRIGTTGVWRRP